MKCKYNPILQVKIERFTKTFCPINYSFLYNKEHIQPTAWATNPKKPQIYSKFLHYYCNCSTTLIPHSVVSRNGCSERAVCHKGDEISWKVNQTPAVWGSCSSGKQSQVRGVSFQQGREEGIAQWLEHQTHDQKVTGKSQQELWENFLLQGQHSVLTFISVSILPPSYCRNT